MTFLRLGRKKLAWLFVLLIVNTLLAIVVFAISADHYLTHAVITSRTNENRSFDANSLTGLAALAGGGQRPTFEQLGFLVQSNSVLRRAVPKLAHDDPQTIAALLRRSAFQQFRLNFEQGARLLLGRQSLEYDNGDRIVDALRASLKVEKTSEGYLDISTTSRTSAGQLDFLQTILAEADATIRAREQIDYKIRVLNYQRLIDEQDNPTERAVLVSLIGREYANFVAAQSSATFSFVYIESPMPPKHIYGTGLLALLLIAFLLAILVFTILIAIGLKRNRP